MTKTLTEQWKNGGLKKDKKYYTKDKLGRTYIKTYNKKGFKGLVEEVLCKVPSYNEWQQMKAFCEEFNALKVAEENAKFNERIEKLEELLKECKRQFEEVELYRYDVADTDQEDWFKISTEQAGIANKMIAKIDEAL